MEYARLQRTVETVQRGEADDDTYAKLMEHESDALRVVERVSDDIRDKKLEASSLWNTPLSTLAKEYVEFVKQVYGLYVAGDRQALMDRLYTPDGLIGGGITVLIVLLLLTLLRT